MVSHMIHPDNCYKQINLVIQESNRSRKMEHGKITSTQNHEIDGNTVCKHMTMSGRLLGYGWPVTFFEKIYFKTKILSDTTVTNMHICHPCNKFLQFDNFNCKIKIY